MRQTGSEPSWSSSLREPSLVGATCGRALGQRTTLRRLSSKGSGRSLSSRPEDQEWECAGLLGPWMYACSLLASTTLVDGMTIRRLGRTRWSEIL